MNRWLMAGILIGVSAIAAQATTYRLGPRDILSVNVYTGTSTAETKGDLPYVEYTVAVNASGSISLPLIGKLKAEGLTVDELELELHERLKKFYQEPQVWAYVKEYLARQVYVLGQVKQNGPVSLDRDQVSLFEVISMAGGFVEPQFLTEGADRRNIIVTRGTERIVVNLHALVTNLREVREFIVQAGDKIFVPKPIRRIQVLGGVKSAGEFELVEGMSLLRAIALAGSFTEKSRRDRVFVIREDGEKKIHVRNDCTQIVTGNAEDPRLIAGDIVYVEEW